MPNQKTTDTIKNLKEKVKKAKSITFVDYLGLNVNNINEFRQQMTDENSESVIAKNTLLKLALEQLYFRTKILWPILNHYMNLLKNLSYQRLNLP